MKIIYFFTGDYIDIEPLHISMTATHVFAASKDNFYIWHFKSPKSRSTVEMTSQLKYFVSLCILAQFFSVIFLISSIFHKFKSKKDKTSKMNRNYVVKIVLNLIYIEMNAPYCTDKLNNIINLFIFIADLAGRGDHLKRVYHIDDTPSGSSDVFREGEQLFEVKTSS